MKYGFFTGCTSQNDSYENELSAREILNYFKINYQDIDEQNCCGTPIKNTKHEMWAFLAARIHALARKQGFDAIATICNGCDLSLSELEHELAQNPELKEQVNAALAKEGLTFEAALPVRNILTILYEDIGVEKIRKSVKKKLKKLTVAVHYGCHALRPTTIARPDDAERPTKMQELLEALGAQAPDYPELLDCCAANIIGVNPEKALTVAGKKVAIIKERGYNSICNICPFCQKQLGGSQEVAARIVQKELKLPSLYLSQYIGLALGIDEEALGLQMNLTGWEELLK